MQNNASFQMHLINVLIILSRENYCFILKEKFVNVKNARVFNVILVPVNLSTKT